MSQITKRALSASLQKLLSHKTLDKITVKDIVEDCGVNRQTFYYHFKDLYDLLEWTYIGLAQDAIRGEKTYDTWQEGFRRLFEDVRENGAFVKNTYHSVSREYLERYLFGQAEALLFDVVEEKARGMSVRSEDMAFIAGFYKYGFVGLILDWIGAGMKEDPAHIIERLDRVIHGSIAAALSRFRTDGGDDKA